MSLYLIACIDLESIYRIRIWKKHNVNRPQNGIKTLNM